MEIRLLGSVEVEHEGQLVDLGPRKQRALLCLLALHANRVVTTDRMLDELWGDEAMGKENALWVAISRLRSALEPQRDGHGGSSMLLTRDHGYTLQIDPTAIDLNRFETALTDARQLVQHDSAAAVRRVDEALALWRGVPLEEFQHQEFVQLAVARLSELRLEALELRAEAELRLGHGRQQIGTLEELHRQHPLRERFVDLLMRSLYQSLRQADALRTFDRYRRSIGDELGIEPSPELCRLEEQILLHDPSIGPAGTVQPQPIAEIANPFKGLRSFGEEDAGDFFGRERVIADVVRRIDAGQRLVALVGASGSGKSSVVRAGVVPAIRKGAVGAPDRWLVAAMVPSSRPLLELEAALLRSTLDAPDSLVAQLTDSDAGLLRAALRILPNDGRLLLVIDQFEELFTLVDDERERSQFLELLGPALDDPHGRIVVLITFRADFYDRPLRYPDFAGRLGDGIVNLSTLAPNELERAMQEPLQQADIAIEPALMATLLTDVIGQPGALPLFQYTLTMLFDRRQGAVLTLDSYLAIGGLKGALAQRAEDLWSSLTETESAVTRQLLLRLVTISGDRDWSRRRVPAYELTSLRRDLVAMQRVIELFGVHRLLAFDRDQVTGSPTVEVAHEALLTEWPRLRTWIDEAHDDVVRHAALVSALVEWREAGGSAGYLLTGQRLVDYEAWAERTAIDLTDHELDFVRRSVAARDDADRGENERLERELALAKRVRRRTAAIFAVVLLAIAGAALAWVVSRDPDLPRVAYVSSPYVEGTAFHLQQAAGWASAQRQHDFEATDLEPLSDPAGEIDALADTGVDLIVVNSDLVGFIAEIAKAHPDTWFAVMDPFAFDFDLPNLTSIHADDEAAGSFLAGAAAALTSETRIVGFLGAHQPINEEFRSGFEAGVAAVDPSIEVISTYLTQTGGMDVFINPSAGAQAARELYAAGADVVFHAAGDSGDPLPKVATEMSAELGRHLWAIGVDVDQSLGATAAQQAHVLTSMLKRHDAMIESAIDRFLAGELPAGVVDVGFDDGAYALATSGNHLTGTTRDRLAAFEADILRGSIVVPDEPRSPPSTLGDADVSIGITVTGDQCRVEAPPSIRFGEPVRFEFGNRSNAPGSMTLIAGQYASGEVPAGVFATFGLVAAAGGTNAGLVRLVETEFAPSGAWTIACIDPVTFRQIGELAPITVTGA